MAAADKQDASNAQDKNQTVAELIPTEHKYWNEDENLPAWIVEAFKDDTPIGRGGSFQDPFKLADEAKIADPFASTHPLQDQPSQLLSEPYKSQD